MERQSGILMHVSSLPSAYGIGTLGQAAYDFIDYLEKAGQSIWQILPLNPTGFMDSPYASSSSFAGNPYFIDLDLLEKDSWLNRDEYQWLDWGDNPEKVDFGKMYNNRYPLLQKAAERFLANPDKEFEQFCRENADWLDDYALFMVLKNHHEGRPWNEWDKEYLHYSDAKAVKWKKEFEQEMLPWKVWQFWFYKQWADLKRYAKEHNIKIVGDIPFYMAQDSADVWASPEVFRIADDGSLASISGYPPMNPDDPEDPGQLWGNPLYDWKAQKKNGYKWWKSRMKHAASLYDILRLDHFIGFDHFYSIPGDTRNAREGKWEMGPGLDFFTAMKPVLKDVDVIVEDLGVVTPSVMKLLEDTGFPGMTIMENAFYNSKNERSTFLPYHHKPNSVAYLGSHDNMTLQGWIESLYPGDREFVQQFVHSFDNNNETLHWDMIRTLMGSPANTAILQAQDLKALGSWAQMNTPGRADSNWAWRMKKGALDDENAAWVRNITDVYERLPKEKKKDEK